MYALPGSRGKICPYSILEIGDWSALCLRLFVCALPGNCRRIAAHTHRAMWRWGQAVCLLAAALILSAVAQARAPERRGRQVVRAAYHRRRRRSAQRPGRAAAVQRGRYPRIAFYGYAR